MGQKIVVGPFNDKGFRNDVTPFNVDNTSFPSLVNAYQWRGRVKRKRGTSLLGRLTRFFSSLVPSLNTGITTITLDGSGNGNLITGFNLNSTLPNVTIAPGNTTITGTLIYEDPNKDGTLEVSAVITGITLGNPTVLTAVNTFSSGDSVLITAVQGTVELNNNIYTIISVTGTTITIDVDSTTFTAYDMGGFATDLVPEGTINYVTGAINIPAQAGLAVSASFNYYPLLPAMGERDLQLLPTQFPGTIAFDITKAYNVVTAIPYPNYNISFYKNPAANVDLYPGYTPKTNATPVQWNGQNYQQFWTTNYENAFWATNGIPIPFNITNIGMQFTLVTGATIVAAGPPAIVTIAIAASPAVVGDFVFINEVVGITGINFQTGYVISIVAGVSITVEFPNATIAGTYGGGGIVQYLTNNVDPTKDCLRWYDGDPTDGVVNNPVPTPGFGWVNFCPPLSQDFYPIADLPAAKYYLVNARMIVPFKDRLLFLGAVVQSSGGTPIYLQDTIVYSQNGTPYYNVSFSATPNYPLPPVTTPPGYVTMLAPQQQTATPSAFFEDQTGFGGFVSAGLPQPITTSAPNQDVLIVGFSSLKTKLVYSGNDLVPFNFFIINSELGDASTFSTITLDKGVLSRGTRGYTMTGQTDSQRIDLDIPDQVFQMNLTNNGNERFCASRDFINEWIYFTYNANNENDETPTAIFPNQTLLYNYRDNSWALFNESYTSYGAFRRQTGFTWQTVGLVYNTWEAWNDPWNAGNSTVLQQEVIGGNSQGFLIFRDEGTDEAESLAIISFNGTTNTVTVPNHNLTEDSYIQITGCLGTVGNFVNNAIFSVFNVTQNTFQLDPDPMLGSATYIGGGLITLIYVPFIQSKQFPLAWDTGRKTRIGVQQYLLTTTPRSEITLQMFLSQDAANPYNNPPIVPSTSSTNNSLLYSQVLYTCPESTNLGLTPFNASQMMINDPSSGTSPQEQIWHRINTSLIGDTVQVGLTMSDEQIRYLHPSSIVSPITGITLGNPTIIMTTANSTVQQQVRIEGVVGTVQLNGNNYHVIASDSTTVTINVDSSMGYEPYISGGRIAEVDALNAFAEIELHGIIMDCSTSSLLV